MSSEIASIDFGPPTEVFVDAAVAERYARETGVEIKENGAPLAYPAVWLAEPRLRERIAQICAEADALPVHESQRFTYEAPLASGRALQSRRHGAARGEAFPPRARRDALGFRWRGCRSRRDGAAARLPRGTPEERRRMSAAAALPEVGERLPPLEIGPFDAQALTRYAEVSGDDNPLHLDDALAQSIGFSAPPVHGMKLLAAFERLLSLLARRSLHRLARRNFRAAGAARREGDAHGSRAARFAAKRASSCVFMRMGRAARPPSSRMRPCGSGREMRGHDRKTRAHHGRLERHRTRARSALRAGRRAARAFRAQ